MENAPTERSRITGRARAATRAAGLDSARTLLFGRDVPGCGGSGYRLTLRETPLGGGIRADGPEGLRVCLCSCSQRRLEGAALEYELEKETEGFRLDQPDTVFAAFC